MGDYGPLSIGQPKLEALNALRANGNWPNPVVYEEQYIDSPSDSDLATLFPNEAGIVVWIGGYPQPLRIEFDDHLVSNKWPEYDIAPTAPKDLKIKNQEMVRLDRSIEVGMARDTVFDAIANFDTEFEVSVGNFVVGEQKFREMRRGEFKKNDPDYRDLILANDGWQFTGLKDQVWYTPIAEPFYSRVTIYFRNDRIERIEHFHLPFELP
ncbi:MAG: hypothetical protein GKS02_12670 [Alphaproteobacteria bacterium]|nr:hypothetical protein [Alphaproteobacteria bacterium]